MLTALSQFQLDSSHLDTTRHDTFDVMINCSPTVT